jgi:hypothetical protein
MAKLNWRAAAFVASLALGSACGVARAQEIPIVTGEHWTRSSEDVKKAYLVGLANVIQIEVAYHAGNPPPDTQSFIPRVAKGLKGGGHTLASVQEGLNKWYASHPDQLQRPVIETIWFEMVVPGLK